MKSANQLVRELVQTRRLPHDVAPFLAAFASEDGATLDLQESTLWDYKNNFPHSRSDDYFGGLLRLVCALYNTFGGLVIFGVDDRTKKIIGNTVRIDIENFNAILREKLSEAIECSTQCYKVSGNKQLDLLLVPKRPIGTLPVRFSVPIGRYREGVTYVRQHHEVIAARSRHMPLLYGPRADAQPEDLADTSTDPIQALPASPATVKEFVGRTKVMDRLWQWLVYDDEPRTFLYGKGGSGKSTIAFEFAKMVSRAAPYIKTSNGKYVDAVIFLSAKKKALDPNAGRVVDFVGNDFETAEELFRQILSLSEWYTADDIDSLSLEQMKIELQELVDTITPVIVIDDIDTLTTQRRDPGMDTLYRIAISAKRGAKLLYTLRNVPTHSLTHAVEVPGLEDDEYREFIEACCQQFKQPSPSEDVIDGPLKRSSECRPLIIEAVVGLRRTSGNYENALRLLQYRAGDDIRSYLFDREYKALSDNRCRYVLSALSLSPKPLGFKDLEIVTRYSPQQVQDALGEVKEMFLTPVNDKSGETLYSLGQATQEYVESRRGELDMFANLRERVRNYTSTFFRHNRELGRLIEEVRKQLKYYRDPKKALAELEKHQDNPKLVEHPVYQAWLGIVASQHSPVLTERAREAFGLASDLGRLDAEALRSWYFLERTSGTGMDAAIQICDSVIGNKSYEEKTRIEFLAKKGLALQTRARNTGGADPEAALRCFAESLKYNIDAYTRSLDIEEMDLEQHSSWSDRSAAMFLSACIEYRRVALFAATIDKFGDSELVCDPLIRTISQLCHWAKHRRARKELEDAVRAVRSLERAMTRTSRPLSFVDESKKHEAALTLKRTVEVCKGYHD